MGRFLSMVAGIVCLMAVPLQAGEVVEVEAVAVVVAAESRVVCVSGTCRRPVVNGTRAVVQGTRAVVGRTGQAVRNVVSAPVCIVQRVAARRPVRRTVGFVFRGRCCR
jgi:hypothetical protein